MNDLRDALDETVRVLAYLWDASGLVDGFTVRDLFAEDDVIRGDVPAAILRGRRALADPDAQRGGLDVERLRRAFAAAWDNNSWGMTFEEPGLLLVEGQTLDGVIAEQVAAEYDRLASDQPKKPE